MYVSDTMKRRHFVERDLTSVSGVRWLKAETEHRSAKVNGLFTTKWQNLCCSTISQPCAPGWRDCFLRRYGGDDEVEVIKVVVVLAWMKEPW